jgi:hypothetical protein
MLLTGLAALPYKAGDIGLHLATTINKEKRLA